MRSDHSTPELSAHVGQSNAKKNITLVSDPVTVVTCDRPARSGEMDFSVEFPHRSNRSGSLDSEEVSMNSSPSRRNVNITNKILENQRLGFHLADEIRNLREDLLSTKQDKRLSLVKNQNLQEQLSRAEERIRQLEDTIEVNQASIKRLEKINTEEAQHYMALQDKVTHLEAEIVQQESHFSSSSKQLSTLVKSNRALSSDVQGLQQYASTLEGALEELNRLSDQKKIEVASLHTKLSQAEQRLAQVERREEALAMRIREVLESNGIVAAHSVTASPERGSDEAVCSGKLEAVVQDLRKAIQRLSEDLRRSKRHQSKLQRIVKYYEDMIPLYEGVSSSFDDF